MSRRRPRSPLFPYTTLFRSVGLVSSFDPGAKASDFAGLIDWGDHIPATPGVVSGNARDGFVVSASHTRSEEHTSELQSLRHLVCRLLLEKKTYTTSCTRCSA